MHRHLFFISISRLKFYYSPSHNHILNSFKFSYSRCIFLLATRNQLTRVNASSQPHPQPHYGILGSPKNLLQQSGPRSPLSLPIFRVPDLYSLFSPGPPRFSVYRNLFLSPRARHGCLSELLREFPCCFHVTETRSQADLAGDGLHGNSCGWTFGLIGVMEYFHKHRTTDYDGGPGAEIGLISNRLVC
jgi:hypothetical protein